MKNFLEKKKNLVLIIFILIIVILIAIAMFLVFRKKTEIHEVNKSNYSLQYDNTWKVVTEEELEIELLHKKSNSKLNIKINELENEYQYKTLDEISDTLLYNIQEQNEDYKLIQMETAKITKNNIDSYKILFETDNSQAVIYFYKQESKVVIFTYEATFDYFDILLDSVNSIIYSFSINEQKFDVITNIDLNITNINYTEQQDISDMLTDTVTAEIASSNFLVNYSIPNNFKSIKYDTEYGSYKFENLSTGVNLYLRTSILKCNLYEYLDRENSTNVYENYNLNTYNTSKEELAKYGNEPLSYIYKNNYLTNNEITENIEIIFELNKNHIFIIRISSLGVGIPEDLVKMIKINNIKNIASNIKVEKEDGYLIGKLKRFVDYTYEETEEITLKIPENYQEIDEGNNLYIERNYVYSYNKEKEIYEYEVSYETSSLNINKNLELLDKEIENSKKYGKYKDFSNGEEYIFNDKKFIVYDRGYTRLSDIEDENGNKYKYYTNEKVLFYELKNDNYLIIKIRTNNNKLITDEQIKQLTNFDIDVK